jgi:hypothetical protein
MIDCALIESVIRFRVLARRRDGIEISKCRLMELLDGNYCPGRIYCLSFEKRSFNLNKAPGPPWGGPGLPNLLYLALFNAMGAPLSPK